MIALTGTPRRLILSIAVVGLLVTAVALFVGGGSPQPVPDGLPTAGAATGWALPLARTLADLAGLFTAGLLLTVSALLPAKAGRLSGVSIRLTKWAGLTAGMWVVAAGCQIVLTLSDEIGDTVGAALAPAQLVEFLTQISQGKALLVQLIGVSLVAIASRFLLTQSGATVVLLIAIAALVSPALTGHSGASSEHEIAVSSLMIHIVAASLWVGGLGGLVAISFIDNRLLRDVAPRFSVIALWCFVILALSGAANAWVRLTSPVDLFTTGYGQLVSAKVILLGVLGWAGWRHRRFTLQQLRGHKNTSAFIRLATVELLVMGAAVGIASALSRTPTPVRPLVDAADVTAARLILGFELPPPPNLLRVVFTQARPDALFVALALIGCALYAVGLRRLSQRGDRWPMGRSVAWFLGMALMIWATSGGIATYSRILFSAHMVQHMTLAMIVPVLLVFGAPSTLALRVLPARRGETGPREWLLGFLKSPVVRILANPFVATALFIGSFYGLYFTSLFGTLMGSHWGHILMQSHFLLTGYAFFWSLIGIDPGPVRLPYPARFVLLMVAMPMHAFFNIAVISASTLLGSGYYESLQRPYATDLLADQRVAGSIGWGLGELPLIMVVIGIGVQWMRADEREANRFDRTTDRATKANDDSEFAAYNQRLARINERDKSQS